MNKIRQELESYDLKTLKKFIKIFNDILNIKVVGKKKEDLIEDLLFRYNILIKDGIIKKVDLDDDIKDDIKEKHLNFIVEKRLTEKDKINLINKFMIKGAQLKGKIRNLTNLVSVLNQRIDSNNYEDKGDLTLSKDKTELKKTNKQIDKLKSELSKIALEINELKK
jgi:hypothetical protein